MNDNLKIRGASLPQWKSWIASKLSKTDNLEFRYMLEGFDELITRFGANPSSPAPTGQPSVPHTEKKGKYIRGVGTVMPSKFNSKCCSCGDWVDKGSMIAWNKGVGVKHYPNCPGIGDGINAGGTQAAEQKALPNLACQALVSADGSRKSCGKSLGEKSKQFGGIPGRKCEAEHISYDCRSCGYSGRAVAKMPQGPRETFFGQYHCAKCDEFFFSEEGINDSWGDLR
jgi:hypothetical protein